MTIEIPLPHWYHGELAAATTALDTLEQRMELVLHFARLNVEHDSGGPFAAAVFEEASGRLVSVGVNRVVPTACSSAHAEIVALTLAQQQLKSYDLGAADLPAHQLVVNWRPCAMCYGALPWSGITSLVIAGSDDALERITGFDEGPIREAWQEGLTTRGITVTDLVLRDEAIQLFRDYAARGLPVYNGRHS
jgi:tRNA(Arg) A34 adenosine deaminase TadA